MATALPSSVGENYHPACEMAVNIQIHLELYASHVYMTMASYFDRDNVDLKHISKFFLRQSIEQMQHAERLKWLQNIRGGRINLSNTCRSEQNYWESPMKAIESALCLAKKVSDNLMNIQQLAKEKNDVYLSNFLEHNFLHKQVKTIQELGQHLSNFLMLRDPEASQAEQLLEKLTLEDKKT